MKNTCSDTTDKDPFYMSCLPYGYTLLFRMNKQSYASGIYMSYSHVNWSKIKLLIM